MLESRELQGERQRVGKKFRWRIDPASVAEYLASRGKFSGGRRGRPNRLTEVERRLSLLIERVDEIESEGVMAKVGQTPDRIVKERDDLRASVVSLKESLARMRSVAEGQAEADAERASVVEHLLAAASAAERADKLRRKATDDLQEALGDATRVGHAGSLRS
jgi:hypothetical protein